jgi:hypothetical protein
MRPEDVEKLLGGYATGTLTEAERQALFEAALANQDLFDALADEEALRELLGDPAARRHLLEQLTEKKSLGQFLFGWWNRRLAWGLAGSAAVTVLLVAVLVPVYRRLAPEHFAPPPAASVEVAQKISPPASTPLAMRRPAPVVPHAQAPAVHRARVEAEVARVAPPAEKPEQAERLPAAPRGVVGGTPGGVIGGISQPPTATVAEARQAQTAAAEPKKLAISAFRLPEAGPPEAQTLSPAALDKARAEEPRSAAVGLHYSILRRDPAGRYAEVAPDTVFQRGDSVRLSVEANQSGTLQLLAQDPAGAWREVQQVTLVPRSRQVLPTKDALAVGGTQRLRLVFSAAPAEEAKLRDQAASRSAVQKMPKEKAVYAVSQELSPVLVDIELRRQ